MKRVLILLAAAVVCLGACAANKKSKPQSFVINTETIGKEVMGYAGTTPPEIPVKDGRIETIDAHTYKFVADVYDAGELLTWARSFIGRVVSFESNNRFAVDRFYGDVRRMAALYGGGEEA